MSTSSRGDARRALMRSIARFRLVLAKMDTPRLLVLGYIVYVVLGWILLALPQAQRLPVSSIDTLFIAASAVSTTGLVSVDPGTSFTFFGQLVILGLIQVGGLGYMTMGSFVTLATYHRLSGVRVRVVRAAFSLPEDFDPARFLWWVLFFTIGCEAAGALALYAVFAQAGVEAPVWSAIFHSVSAFCTAGFSLNATSFEAFVGNPTINLVVGALSLLGAMGFLVVFDAFRTGFGRQRYLGFTSKVIFRLTLLFVLVGTVLILAVEPVLAEMPPTQRLLAAFFQTMTASTTVGFNTVPIADLSNAVIVVLLALMVVGASPAGTGGGLKTTSLAVLVGLVRSTLKGRDDVRYFNRTVPIERVRAAAASLAFYAGLLTFALFLLFLTERGAAFETVLFEAVSAMGTVGLSMGITGELSELGKLIIVVLMLAGRVGILTFGIALATHDEPEEEQEDCDLVL